MTHEQYSKLVAIYGIKSVKKARSHFVALTDDGKPPYKREEYPEQERIMKNFLVRMRRSLNMV